MREVQSALSRTAAATFGIWLFVPIAPKGQIICRLLTLLTLRLHFWRFWEPGREDRICQTQNYWFFLAFGAA